LPQLGITEVNARVKLKRAKEKLKEIIVKQRADSNKNTRMELENFKELWNKDTGQELLKFLENSEIHSPLQMLKVKYGNRILADGRYAANAFNQFPFASADFNIKTISAFVTILTLLLYLFLFQVSETL
jgi:hypothetical protein